MLWPQIYRCISQVFGNMPKYTILSLHAAQYGNQRATDAQGMQAFENRVIHTSAVYTV